MNQQQLKRQSQQILTKMQKNLKNSLEDLMSLTQPDSWIIFQFVCKQWLSKYQADFQFRSAFENGTRYIKTLPMLMCAFNFVNQNRLSSIYVYWKLLYKQICILQNELDIYNQCIIYNTQDTILQVTLNMLVKVFPTFINEQFINISDLQFKTIICWVSFVKTNTQQQFQNVCKMVRLIKEMRTFITQDWLRKEHLVLKKIIQICGMNHTTSGNTFLLLDPTQYKEKQIDYFCHVYAEFLSNLDQQHLYNVFLSLIKTTITQQILQIIVKISHILLSQEQYYKLRNIYEKLILPILIRNYKCCIKLQNQVYEVAELFIIGFLQHCNIGTVGLQCITHKIQIVTDEKVLNKWIQILLHLYRLFPMMKNQIIQYLKEKKISHQNFDQVKLQIPNEKIWHINIRNGRKHKIYPKVASKLKGIENNHNECYIISVVQALYMIATLQELLDKNREFIKGKKPIMDQLRMLFGQLSGKRPSQRIVVTYLKKSGIAQFASSRQQQDSQQYLISLFAAIENQIGSNKPLLKEFNNMFLINYNVKLCCQKCKHQSLLKQQSYIHTIPHAQPLSLSLSEQIEGYKCQQCGGIQKCLSYRELDLHCRIFIVHINRFSLFDKQTVKQLGTQPIARKIVDYQLVGILFHIGKNVRNGHYIYYAKIAYNKWVEMNDKFVGEIMLENENQEFERQMKAQQTAYLLFYRKST